MRETLLHQALKLKLTQIMSPMTVDPMVELLNRLVPRLLSL